MLRRFPVLALFLGAALSVSTRARAAEPVVEPVKETADEAVDEPMDEGSFWDASSEGLWDTAWDDSWLEALERPQPFALHLTAGRRTDLVTPRAQAEEVTPMPRRQSEVYALATLQVPLESLFFARGPRTRKKARSLSTTDASETPSTEEPATVPPPQSSGPRGSEPKGDSTEMEPAPSPASALPASAPPSSRTQTPAQNRGEVEGSSTSSSSAKLSEQGQVSPRDLLRLIREVAKRVARAEAKGDGRLNSLVRRSRLSGLVPEVRFRGVYGLDQQTSTEDAVGIYPGETSTRGGRDSLLEARLTFRLDRLVLGAGEDSLERQRAQRAREGREAVTVAVETLMKWRVAMSQSQDPALLPEEQLAAQVNAERALCELYLLTGGWFVGQATLDELGIDLPALVTTDAP